MYIHVIEKDPVQFIEGIGEVTVSKDGKNFKICGQDEIQKFSDLDSAKQRVYEEYIRMEYSSFRKFNALHGYFAKYHDVDDIHEVELTEDIVKEIYSILDEICRNPEQSRELLPVYDGPFFGSFEYDRLYYSYVREARDAFYHAQFIDRNQYRLVYSASW